MQPSTYCSPVKVLLFLVSRLLFGEREGIVKVVKSSLDQQSGELRKIQHTPLQEDRFFKVPDPSRLILLFQFKLIVIS